MLNEFHDIDVTSALQIPQFGDWRGPLGELFYYKTHR